MKALAYACALLVCMVSCKKTPAEVSVVAVDPQDSSTQDWRFSDLGFEREAPPPAVQALLENFQRVHFETDSSTLSAGARDALDENAVIMQSHLDIQVEVQGHADERGTVDYNLALGQRRAEAVTGYLTHLGVSGSRLRSLSFGEESPITGGTGERAWAENRRAEFRVVWGQGSTAVGNSTR